MAAEWLAIGVLGAAVAAFAVLAGELFRQYGRVLLRLDALEQRVSELDSLQADRRTLATERPLSESRLLRDGIPAGSPAPSFALVDVRGSAVSSSDYAGRPFVLVFSDPNCGPCEALLPELVRLHREGVGELVMVSCGTVEANRREVEKHGLDFPVLAQDGRRLSKEYGIFATPVAFLVDGNGIVARDVAKGRDQILQLIREGLPRARETAGEATEHVLATGRP